MSGISDIYHKRQKLNKRRLRKVSLFTGFHPNVGKTFVDFASSALKVLPLLKAFVGKTFTTFLSRYFCDLGLRLLCRHNFENNR